MESLYNPILHGIISGIFVGIVLSTYEAFKGKAANKRIRKEQIEYLRTFITQNMNRIESAKSFEFKEAGKTANQSQIAFIFYEDFRRNLNPCLEYRSTHLSFDEKKQITNPFFPIDWVLDNPDLQEKRKIPELKSYRRAFDELRVIKWLNLK